MPANENGRAATEVTTPPVESNGPVSPYATVTVVDAREWMPSYPRPMGATPLYPPLSLLPDADPQDMGDALAQEHVSYCYRWWFHLARGDA